jgi:transposase InsO family protein
LLAHIITMNVVNMENKRVIYLIIVDAFDKFPRPTKIAGAQEVVDHLNDLFSMFGTPKRIISDRGKAFKSSTFKAFITRYHVRHVLNAVASLRSNGQVERYNRTIVDGLNTSRAHFI